jgi:hypothetical protein
MDARRLRLVLAPLAPLGAGGKEAALLVAGSVLGDLVHPLAEFGGVPPVPCPLIGATALALLALLAAELLATSLLALLALSALLALLGPLSLLAHELAGLGVALLGLRGALAAP